MPRPSILAGCGLKALARSCRIGHAIRLMARRNRESPLRKANAARWIEQQVRKSCPTRCRPVIQQLNIPRVGCAKVVDRLETLFWIDLDRVGSDRGHRYCEGEGGEDLNRDF